MYDYHVHSGYSGDVDKNVRVDHPPSRLVGGESCGKAHSEGC